MTMHQLLFGIMRRATKWLLITLWCFFASTFLFFSIIEIAPGLLAYLPVANIHYYSNKKRNAMHETLVYELRDKRYIYEGELAPSMYGYKEPAVPFLCHYTENGFRVNSSKPPYDMVFIGDSFIEIGENDASTITEYLAKETSLSIYNMGRSGYSPYQYVALLETYGVKAKPKYAVFCFYAGNDILDLLEYEKWLNGGNYYRVGDESLSYFKRYFLALSDAVLPYIPYQKADKYLRTTVKEVLVTLGLREAQQLPQPSVADLASEINPLMPVLKINDREVMMTFRRNIEPLPVVELLKTDAWLSLAKLIERFKTVCHENDIQPLLLYIPDKFNIYQRYLSDKSGYLVREPLAKLQPFAENDCLAIQKICLKNEVPCINLLPRFKELTDGDELLYYQFDEHWKDYGIKTAASYIAEEFKNMGILKEKE
jgi:hypothetical protein